MIRRRAFTLVEVMLATTMTVVLIGVTTVLYAFTMSRLGHCLSLYATQRETENAIDPIDQTMRMAQSCTEVTVNSAACIKCTMPQTCSDSNHDSIDDSCTPYLVNRRGYERYGAGQRVWFYMSDSSGVPASAGTNLTMAVVASSDTTPTAGNVVSTFGKYPGQTTTMFDLLSGFSVTNPSQTRSTKVSVSSASLTRDNTVASDSSATATERTGVPRPNRLREGVATLKRRRGSAILFVLILLTIIATMMLSYATLSVASVTSETRREQATIAQYLFDGATLKAAIDAGNGTISVPTVTNETVGSYTVALSVSDNGSSLAHSLSQSSAIVLFGRTYSDSRVTALKTPYSPFWYAISANSSLNTGSHDVFGSSGANGDVYCNGNLNVGSQNVINGDADCTGTITAITGEITGASNSGTTAISFPSFTTSNYTSLGSLLGGLVGGHSFGSSYSVAYIGTILGLPVNMSGTFSGKGIVYVNGNLQITDNMSYSSSTDEVLFIVTGNITVQSGVSNIVGYFYTTNSFSSGGNWTLTRGAIAAGSVSIGSHVTINYDPTIWTTIGEAKRMKMPGFWP